MKQIFTSLFLVLMIVVAFAQDPDNAVGGTVTDQDMGIVYSGYVKAFMLTESGAYPVVDSAQLDSSGGYLFQGLAPATYTFQVWPDREKNSMWLPTYAGGVMLWSMAHFIDVKSDTRDTLLNIAIRLDPPRSFLGGELSGNVSYNEEAKGAKGTKGKPYKKASILLVKKSVKKSTQSDGVTDYRETNDQGDFYFGMVMAGEYYLHVDVPGLPMIQTYDVEVVDSATSISGLDFVVTMDGINTTEHMTVDPPPVEQMRIFPNPGNGLLYVDLPVTGDYRIRIYNTVGKQVDSREALSTGGLFRMDVSGLQDGLYFIEIEGTDEKRVAKYIKR
ncbi:MAG: T9SS type A sorting domain-containing protein [Bacteroidota bacterium]